MAVPEGDACAGSDAGVVGEVVDCSEQAASNKAVKIQASLVMGLFRGEEASIDIKWPARKFTAFNSECMFFSDIRQHTEGTNDFASLNRVL